MLGPVVVVPLMLRAPRRRGRCICGDYQIARQQVRGSADLAVRSRSSSSVIDAVESSMADWKNATRSTEFSMYQYLGQRWFHGCLHHSFDLLLRQQQQFLRSCLLLPQLFSAFVNPCCSHADCLFCRFFSSISASELCEDFYS
jgi:hypothetical protein